MVVEGYGILESQENNFRSSALDSLKETVVLQYVIVYNVTQMWELNCH